MSSIQLSGLSTGIDMQALISQLMAVERRTLTMYESRKETWDAKKDALSDLESRLESLRTTARTLSDAEALRAFTVSSSDTDKITAEASHNAFEGSHTIEVNQLAAAERWVHSTGLEYAEDYVGAGTFIYSYNHEEVIVETTTETTLEELVGLINNDADNPGLTAGLLYYNDTYHMVLSGNDAGTDYEVSINDSSTEVWQANSELTNDGDNATLSTKITDLDQFTLNGGLVGDEQITITGTDHSGAAITPVNLNVTGYTSVGHLISEINDAFDGVAKAAFENGKIILTDSVSGASGLSVSLGYSAGTGDTQLTLPTMAVSAEGGSTTASLTGFASTDFLETQSAQDAQMKVDNYPPGVDEWITRSSNTIDDVISGVTLHLHDTTDGDAEEIGMTRDTESVKEKLEKFVEAYNDTVAFIKEKTGYNDVLKTGGLLMGDYVVSTIREQLRSPIYLQRDGFVQDIDTFLNAGQIGLELDNQGMLSLDSTAFDEAISEDYLGVLAMIGADKNGSSDSTAIKFYSASSNHTDAGSYTVKVEYSGGAVSAVYFKLASEGDSEYRQGTFSGNVATGLSEMDDNGYALYPEHALSVTIPTTGSSDVTATVRVKHGFAGAIEDSLDRMLQATSGSLQINQEHVDDQIKLLADKIDSEEYRLSIREERLILRFARLERTMALLQGQMAYLGFA